MKLKNPFSAVRQQQLLSHAIKLAGERYNDKLNVRIDAPVDQLNIVAHADPFLVKIEGAYKNVNSQLEKGYDKKLESCVNELSQKLKKFIDGHLLSARDWSQIRNSAQNIREECFVKLKTIEDQKNSGSNSSDDWRKGQYYRDLIPSLYRLDDILCKENQELYHSRIAILQGDGGIGKTHLLCDYSTQRLASGTPTFLFLADDLPGRNPIVAIAKKLGFKSKKTFLKELQAFASQQTVQVCFIVDAINENPTMVWKRMVDLLAIANVSVVLSIRNGFETATKIANWDIPKIWHYGFAESELEWEAMQKYFQHYNLHDIPDTPVLYEEFRNPLFLKIFCESYDANECKKPRGHIMTNIFEQYVVKKTKVISKHLDKKDLWKGVVKPISEHLGAQGIKPTISYRKLCHIIPTNILIKTSFDAKTLIDSMCYNGILRKITHYTKDYKRWGYDYEFIYHKFSDHVIVRYFLNSLSNTSKDDIPKLLAKSTLFKRSLKEGNSGIIEALAIQYPERCMGQELVSIIPKQYRFSQMVWSAILNSIIWRKVEIQNGDYLNINPEILKRYITGCNKYDGMLLNKYLDTLITLGPIPNHPFNALELHRVMLRNPMPKRDAWWAEYTAYAGTEGDPFSRLCSWVFSGFGETADLEQRELAAIVLSWFLASTNRGVRDRASYAIIKILKNSMLAAHNLLCQFEDCDDQYILERLFLITYSSAIYEHDEQVEFLKLVKYIDESVFKNPNRIPNIIIDQCARDIITLYQSRYGGLDTEIIERCSPPYDYSFQVKRLPSIKTILEKYGSESSNNNCMSIIGSVLYPDAGIADFGNYTMGGLLGGLTNIPLSDSLNPEAVSYHNFMKSLSKAQIHALDNYHDILRKSKDTAISPIIIELLGNSDSAARTASGGYVIPASTTSEDVKRAKNIFVDSLTSSQRQKLTGNTAKYIFENKNPYRQYIHREYDVTWARRWVFQNVLRLGWKYDIHGRFDDIRYRHDHMRGSSDIGRLERIGKKYQWVSLHQIMAIASSRYYLANKWFSGGLPEPYDNSLDFNDRSFDPTIPTEWVINYNGYLYQSDDRIDLDNEEMMSWWKPSHSILDKDEWLMSTDDIPELKHLIYLTDDNRKYISLINWPTWRKNFGKNRWRQLWIQVSSFVVKLDDMQKIKAWCDSKRFNSTYDDFPTLASYGDTFLGEIIKDTPMHRIATQDFLDSERATDKRSFSVIATTVEYNGDHFELGPIMQHRTEMPSPFLRNILELKDGASMSFVNDKRGYNIFFPSLSTVPNSDQFILLASDNILDALLDKGYTILWTEIGEKRELGDLHSAPDSICLRGYAYVDKNGQFTESTKFYKISEKFRRE